MFVDPTIAVVEPAEISRWGGNPDGSDLDTYWLKDARSQAMSRASRDIPFRYRDAVASEPAVTDWVRTLVTGARDAERSTAAIRRGPSLLLVGGVGTGKTYQAFGAIRALAISGAYFTWQFTSAADCYAALRPRAGVDSEQEFEKYSKPGLLVLDDLGVAKGSEWTEEINYRLINYRYEREMPTLITSNVPPKQLGAALGDRVASRLAEMTSQVALKGPDRRRSA